MHYVTCHKAGRAVSIVPLNGTTRARSKFQYRMALIREGLWGIVAGTEKGLDVTTEAEKYKFMVWSDRALATIILAINTSLL